MVRMIISRTSRIMSVILVRAHWMALAGLLTTEFNIVFQMRRKATLMHTRSEQRLAARFFIKLYSSVVKIDRPVIPCGINCTYRLLCFAEGKRGEKVCGLRGICAERFFFLISYAYLFFFFQTSQCHLNFMLIDTELPHIYTAPKFIITPDISKSEITKPSSRSSLFR